MIRTISSIAILTSVFTAVALAADPAPKKTTTNSSKKTKPTEHATPAPIASGWSLANGVWVHPDGYKLVRGKVVRSSVQTRKSAPLPPTLAELQAASNKEIAAKTAAEIAAEKEAYRLRKLPSRRAPQTGTFL